MQTPSHFLITAFATEKAKKTFSMPIHMPALLIGSVLPDIPFTLLTIAGLIWFQWFSPLPVTDMSSMEYLHLDRFFRDPLWIVSHNFFHSLIINCLLIGLGSWGIRRGYGWSLFIFWLAVSTQFHTVIDIFTHSSDGPLILFPQDWTYRFQSPVSYWESTNYGQLFIVFEYILDGILISYFFLRRRRRTVF